jgi:hypothetical protein
MLWSTWTSFWYYCSLIDYCVLLSIRYLIYSSLGRLRDAFMSFATFLEDNVTVEFFIYFIFLPITIIPTILINHAGGYTLPYSKCGGPRHARTRSRQSGRQGLHLFRYHASLRNKSTIIYHPTTFKTGRVLRVPKLLESSISNAQVDASRRCSSTTAQVDALIATNPSIELDLFLFESKLYWKASSSDTTISSTRIDAFLQSFNVMEHYHNIKSYVPSNRYKSLDSTSSQFQRILLEAKGLQTSIQQYGEILPLSTSPAIYVSSNKDDLPIVIDTGASCTITPSLSDFTSQPTTPDTATLGSLTTVHTKVTGQGPTEWDIEDVNGVVKKLQTTSYYVPEATIRLFSPQAYFKYNPKGYLTLNSEGITLHMPCGTNLKFPIQPGSNLPVMLTRQALHQSRTSSSKFRPPHMPSLNTMSNVLSFICSTTYDHFAHGALFHLQHAGAMAVIICDDAVLKHANNNLSPEQKELLLWHYRLGHIGIARVQSLLQKPRSRSFNDTQTRLISPSNNKSSHCHAPLCAFCQYAKQKRKSPPKSTTAIPCTTTGLSDNILNAGDGTEYLLISTDLPLMDAFHIRSGRRKVIFNILVG